MSWLCPLTHTICGKQHYIYIDGNLKHIESHTDIDYIARRGAAFVDFPERPYYPERDQTSPFYKNKNVKDFDELPIEII